MPTCGTVFPVSVPCSVMAYNPAIQCSVSFGHYAEHVKQIVFWIEFYFSGNFYCLFVVINVSVVVNNSVSFGS